MKLHLFCLKSLLILSILCPTVAFAQPANDICDQAVDIVDLDSFCSNVGSYSNENATSTGFTGDGELSSTGKDIWFKFTAIASHITITIRGLGTGGTLASPEVQLLRDNQCENEFQVLDSAVSGFADIVELNKGGLTPGASYLFRVQAANENEGTFQLCVNNYFPPQTPGSDFDIASVLCDKSSFVVQEIGGAGLDDNEADDTCLDVGGVLGDIFGEPTEQSSTWFTWIAANDGSLEFTLDPLNPLDDIDFVLFQLPNGINNGDDRFVLRCMATSCEGPTGLRDSSTDIAEDANCDEGEDGFVKSIQMVAGTAYGLLINNFTESGSGFTVEFGGTGVFQTPEAIITPPESDQLCLGDTVSYSANISDEIKTYEWIFGVGAEPATGLGANPGPVSYTSPGEKTVVLTVTSELNCKVTEVIESVVTVNACCLDVAIVTDVTDIFSGDSVDLESEVTEANGEVTYQWFPSDILSCINCPNPTITPTEDVSVFLNITDAEGCEAMDTLDIIIKLDSCFLKVAIDRDSTVLNLGEMTTLEAEVEEETGEVTYQWSPSEILSCDTCPNPTITPTEDVTVFVTVTDTKDCEAIDSLDFIVNFVLQEITIPNAFTPDGDKINDLFKILGRGDESIISFNIYSRWGNLVYELDQVKKVSEEHGWNGTYKNGNTDRMPPDVYIYHAVVEEDGQEMTYTGDITLIR